MKNMKDNPQLKPTTPDRSYLRQFIEKFKTHQNGRERKILIEKETLPYLIILSLLNAFLLHDFKSNISSFFGSFIVIFLLLIFFYRDLKRYKPAYLKKKKMMALLASLIVFTLIISRGFEHIFLVFSKGLGVESIIIHTFGIPLAIGPVIVVLIFDFHTAITFSLILSLMAGIWLKTSLIPLYVFIGCLIGAFSLLKCKKRTDIINAGIYISLANIFSSSAVLLIMGFFDLYSLYFAVVFSVINGFTVSALCFFVFTCYRKIV